MNQKREELKTIKKHEKDDKRDILRQILTKLIIREPKDLIEVPELVQGFGTIILDSDKCISCGACTRVCKSKALIYDLTFNMKILRKQAEDPRFKKRRILLDLIKKLNDKISTANFKVPEGLLGFGKIQLVQKNCIFGKECIPVCPYDALSAKKIWNVKEFLS